MSTSEPGRIRDACEIIRAHLNMEHRPVGVRFVFDEPGDDPPRPDKPGWYCQMVLQAAAGRPATVRMEDLSCPNSELSLGFRKPRFVKIKTGFDRLTRAVVVGPVRHADVILLILNNRQTMNMSILLGGISAEFRGEVAVCGEATAQVYLEGLPNLSFLCNGARLFGGYTDSEVVLGLPPLMAEKAADRILETRTAGGALGGCAVADLPEHVREGFRTAGFSEGPNHFAADMCGLAATVFLDKDAAGAISSVTLCIHEPAPLKNMTVRPPFITREREGRTEIYATFDARSIGADLYSGGGKLRNTFAELICSHITRLGAPPANS